MIQKVRSQAFIIALLLVVSLRFQFLFHSPPGVLFTFPSRYLFTIGHPVVFSLGRWSSLFLTGFHVARDTLDNIRLIAFYLQGFYLLWLDFPVSSVRLSF